MSANDYHLVSHWRVPATAEEVYSVLSDARALPLWWPSVCLDVLEFERGDDSGGDAVIRLETRGNLPWVLNWHLHITETRPPHSFTFKVWGDVEGQGRWTLTEDGPWCNIIFEWTVTLRKGLLRYLWLAGRPLFVADHRWAMQRGEESLRLELARRRAADSAARAAIPAPPGPARSAAALPLVLAGSVAGLLLLRRKGNV